MCASLPFRTDRSGHNFHGLGINSDVWILGVRVAE